MSDAPLDSADGRSETDSGRQATAVTPDGAFRALSDPQRRALVSYLHEHPNELVAVETLAGVLASDESDQRHVAASLATTQLPELDSCGIVDYDSEYRTVRYTDSPLVNGLLARLNE